MKVSERGEMPRYASQLGLPILPGVTDFDSLTVSEPEQNPTHSGPDL
jgi:hypothetical protein